MASQTVLPPELDDLLAESRETVFSTLNSIEIGKLEVVNDDQTVSIQIQVLRRKADGTTSKYPLLVDCPYFVLQGGDAYIDMPIKKGDDCLVLFNDRNIDNWWSTGNVAVPADTRKHDLSDGFALVGINREAKALNRDGDAMRMMGPGSNPAFIKFNPDGSMDINAPAGLNIVANTEITGTLTVSDLIKGAKDIIADWTATAISLLNHFHQGNLGYPTGKSIMTGGGTTPSTPPATDDSGDLITGAAGNSLDDLKTEYDSHTHDYTWTAGGGSGTTGTPN